MTDIDTAYVRARLRDASGDSDLWETRAADHISDALDEIDRLRARLAAVEAERGAYERSYGNACRNEAQTAAKLAAVEAELARREKCAADERAAGRVCDYCEDFIPEVRAALGEPPADTSEVER